MDTIAMPLRIYFIFQIDLLEICVRIKPHIVVFPFCVVCSSCILFHRSSCAYIYTYAYTSPFYQAPNVPKRARYQIISAFKQTNSHRTTVCPQPASEQRAPRAASPSAASSSQASATASSRTCAGVPAAAT